MSPSRLKLPRPPKALRFVESYFETQPEVEVKETHDTEGWGKVTTAILNQVREEGFQAGFQEGARLTRAEYDQKLSQVQRMFAQAVQEIQSQYVTRTETMNQTVLELALKIAEKVIGVSLQPEEKLHDVVLKQLERFFKQLADQQNITVQVHPSLLEWLKEQDLSNKVAAPLPEKIRFAADPHLQPGEVIVESEDLLLEGTWKHYLEAIEEELKAV